MGSALEYCTSASSSKWFSKVLQTIGSFRLNIAQAAPKTFSQALYTQSIQLCSLMEKASAFPHRIFSCITLKLARLNNSVMFPIQWISLKKHTNSLYMLILISVDPAFHVWICIVFSQSNGQDNNYEQKCITLSLEYKELESDIPTDCTATVSY